MFDVATVSIDMTAQGRNQVLEQLVDLAVKGGRLPAAKRRGVLDALIKRESLGSTGIGQGVAIPHVKTNEVSETISAIAVSENGVDFNAVDGEDCDVFILLVSPEDEAERHLEILRWISKLVRSSDFVRFVRNAKNAREVVGLLKEMGD
jgi:mannitol/fructose-specific phosphotransferase system IIA component (Ntr-type)